VKWVTMLTANGYWRQMQEAAVELDFQVMRKRSFGVVHAVMGEAMQNSLYSDTKELNQPVCCLTM